MWLEDSLKAKPSQAKPRKLKFRKIAFVLSACTQTNKYENIHTYVYTDMPSGNSFSSHLHDGEHALERQWTEDWGQETGGGSRATNENCKNDRKWPICNKNVAKRGRGCMINAIQDEQPLA